MKSLLVFFGVFISTVCFSRELIFSFTPTTNSAFYYQFVSGGASPGFKSGFITSVEYILKSNSSFSYGGSLNFQHAQVKFKPAYTGDDYLRIPKIEKASLLSSGVILQFDLKKSYMRFEPFISYQLNKSAKSDLDDQTGLGLAFGYGKKLNLNTKLFLKVEPELRVNNIIPFVDSGWQRRLTSLGIKLGIGFIK